MAEETGKLLYDQGWKQGVAFGPLSYLIHFRISESLRIPKSAVEDAQRGLDEGGSAGPAIGQAVVSAKTKDRWILATQDCDLVKAASIEPNVVAIRCFTTSNERTLIAAASNSSYYFLIDPDEGLVADARIQIQLEKPALREFVPSDPFRSQEARQRFARWLARRSDRPAVKENVVEYFVAPVLDCLNKLRTTHPAAIECLADVLEIRFRSIGDSPIETAIVFFVEKGYPLDGGIALAELVGLIIQELDDEASKLVGWDAISYDEISVAEYVAMNQLYLDSYTFQGQTRVGLGPSPRL